MKRGFSGWIPTITGQLSFSLIGRRSDKLDCVTVNQEDAANANPPARTLVSLVRRVAKDVPLPLRLRHPARIKHYIVIGRTASTVRPSVEGVKVSAHPDELGLLEGAVYVVPYHKNPDLRERAKLKIGAVRREISGFIKGSDVSVLRSAVEGKIHQADGVKVLVLEFSIYRTGELRILANASINEVLCQQVYYLLKDMAHRHYHHAQADDNLLPLTAAGPADDLTWRRNTLWCLARMVLEARRRDRLDGYKNALGMLAYAEAFQGLLGRVSRTAPDKFSLIKGASLYDFAHARASLDAKIAENEYRINAKTQVVAIGISTVLATIALWISAVQISEPVCETIKAHDGVCGISVPHFSAHVVEFLIERPFETYGILLLVALVYLGRRILSFMPLAIADYIMINWSQAVGASASRKFGSNDQLGKWAMQSFVVLVNALIFFAVGFLTRVISVRPVLEALVDAWSRVTAFLT